MLQSALKTAMLDQLNSVYGLAYAMTRCPNTAEQLSFHSFGIALRQVKLDNCISCSPRVLLFRSLYHTLCGATPASTTAFSSLTDPIDTPETMDTTEYGELDWQSASHELNAALDSIPIGLRFVLYLWAVEAVPSREIAEVLEVSAEVVCIQLKKARERLYRSLTLNRQRKVRFDTCKPYATV